MSGLKEVARAAGVSARTVSRVMRDEGNVSPETAARIRRAANELGYRANLAAKSLRSRRQHEIVLVIWSVAYLREGAELLLGKIEGLERRFAERDLPLRVRIERQDLAAPNHPLELIAELAQQPPLGVVLCPFRPDFTRRCVEEIERAGVPTVVLDEVGADPSVDCIGVDRTQGIREAVRYLHSKGRRRIAYLGPDEIPTRLEGYHAGLKDTGLQEMFLFIPGSSSSEQLFQQGRAMGRNLIHTTPRPDAVQAYSDPVAQGFIEGLKEAGIRVPEDVAVVGFDDRWSAVLCQPQLTTVAQPHREVGLAAAEALLEKIAGKPRPPQGWSRSIPGRLVIRGSA